MSDNFPSGNLDNSQPNSGFHQVQSVAYNQPVYSGTLEKSATSQQMSSFQQHDPWNNAYDNNQSNYANSQRHHFPQHMEQHLYSNPSVINFNFGPSNFWNSGYRGPARTSNVSTVPLPQMGSPPALQQFNSSFQQFYPHNYLNNETDFPLNWNFNNNENQPYP